MYKIGFIGCGNMGGALMTAALKTVNGKNIAVCDHNPEKIEKFIAQGVRKLTAEEIAQQAKFIMLGVKPQAMENTLAPLKTTLCARDNVTVITMAAGLSIAAIRAYIGKDLPVIRIMPNTPVTLGEGMTIYATDGVDEETESEFLTVFSAAGIFDKIPEDAIDAGSALSGCGPAFVYAFAEALIDGAMQIGIPQDKAELYTAQTLLGAAKMLQEYGDPAALRKAVCSPNGTTLAGIRALNEADFHNVSSRAVTAAYKRTLELKK
jgi:pyrroline-5-carboxylate reductase